jgi:hypothetical protein
MLGPSFGLFSLNYLPEEGDERYLDVFFDALKKKFQTN